MMQTEPLSITQSANRRIRSFRERFGDGHFYLACHAALPLALTPDLLYRLWATFQRDCQDDDDLAMPWIAVSDLLLSGLCDEVGDVLYEMDSTVRDELMQQLKDSPRLGLARVRELAEFVIAYIDPQRASADLDTRDFAQAQHWRALAYQQPWEAVQAIATTLAELSFDETHEWMRMAALVEALEDPLEEFPELLVYVGAIDDFVRRNDRSAIDKLKQIADENQQIQIADIDLPLPIAIQKDPLPTEPVTLKRKIHLIDRLKQNAYWLIGGGIAVTTVAIGAINFSGTDETVVAPPSTISSATPSPKVPTTATPSPQPTRSVSSLATVSVSPSPSGIPRPSPTSTIQPIFSQPTQDSSATVTSTQPALTQPKPQSIPPIANSSSIEPSASPPNVNPIMPPIQQSPTQQQVSDGLTETEVQEILDTHNQCRSKFGISPLKWSSSIASLAQKRATEHSRISKNPSKIENTGEGGFATIWVTDISPIEFVDSWCNGKSEYDKHGYRIIVEKNIIELGCGTSSHPKYGQILVCYYLNQFFMP